MFSESTEAVFQRQPRLDFVLWLDLVMCKSYPGGTGFEGMKGSCRAAEALHCERPWKAIGEGANSGEIDVSILKRSCSVLELIGP